MLLLRCAVYNSKKSGFIKKQSRRLLSTSGVKTPLSNISLLGDFLF